LLQRGGVDGGHAKGRPLDRRKLALSALGFSICVFALNDHIFKGHPTFPAWLTGKLSDVAGLIVAPLTLIVLFGVTSRRSRLFCLLAPAAFLALINLSAECSLAVVEALAMIGLSWRLWPDLTDLWSLLVLPLTWILATWIASPRRASAAGAPSSVGARLLGLAGAVACLATSQGPATHSAPAYLVNRTGQTLEVEVAELLGTVDCSGSAPAIPSNFLRHDDFAQGLRYALEPNAVLPLPVLLSSSTCGPVRIVLPELTMGVDWDKGAAHRELPNIVDKSDLEDTRQLVLIPGSDSTSPPSFGRGTRHLGIVSDSDPLPVSDCAQAALPRLEFSGENGAFSELTLVAMEAVSDACFRVTLAFQLDAARERDLYLCMPQSLFPFVVGDVLDGYVADNDLKLSRRPAGTPTLELYRGYSSSAFGTLRFVEATCGFVRDGCGALWQPVDAYGFHPAQADTLLVPGESVSAPDSPHTSYHLIRALRPVVLRPECDPASAQFGIWIELIRRRDQ
jgi:hypothetical protein